MTAAGTPGVQPRLLIWMVYARGLRPIDAGSSRAAADLQAHQGHIRRQMAPGAHLVDQALESIAEEGHALTEALELLHGLTGTRLELDPQVPHPPPLPAIPRRSSSR